jgi:hypothetical protein
MHVVLVTGDVMLSLVFLSEKLQLLNDLGLVECGFHSLVVEQHYPKASNRIRLQLSVLQLLLT